MNTAKQKLFTWGVTLLCIMNAWAIETPQEEATRYRQLIQEVRCIVCQNQSLAESTAPLANDLREKIQQMILEKKSDAEIKAYLVKRYGEFILLRPRLNKYTLFLWLFPALGLGLMVWYLLRLTPRKRSHP